MKLTVEVLQFYYFLAFSEYQVSDRKQKMIEIYCHIPPGLFLIETLMEAVKPIVIEKYEFECRDVSKLAILHYLYSDERRKISIE